MPIPAMLLELLVVVVEVVEVEVGGRQFLVLEASGRSSEPRAVRLVPTRRPAPSRIKAPPGSLAGTRIETGEPWPLGLMLTKSGAVGSRFKTSSSVLVVSGMTEDPSALLMEVPPPTT
jgi:hypothetical protein